MKWVLVVGGRARGVKRVLEASATGDANSVEWESPSRAGGAGAAAAACSAGAAAARPLDPPALRSPRRARRPLAWSPQCSPDWPPDWDRPNRLSPCMMREMMWRLCAMGPRDRTYSWRRGSARRRPSLASASTGTPPDPLVDDAEVLLPCSGTTGTEHTWPVQVAAADVVAATAAGGRAAARAATGATGDTGLRRAGGATGATAPATGPLATAATGARATGALALALAAAGLATGPTGATGNVVVEGRVQGGLHCCR